VLRVCQLTFAPAIRLPLESITTPPNVAVYWPYEGGGIVMKIALRTTAGARERRWDECSLHNRVVKDVARSTSAIKINLKEQKTDVENKMLLKTSGCRSRCKSIIRVFLYLRGRVTVDNEPLHAPL
jgi:hypothetical protein